MTLVIGHNSRRTLPPLPGLPSQYQSSGSTRPLLFPYAVSSSHPSSPSPLPLPTEAASNPLTPPSQASRYELLVESLSEFYRFTHSKDDPNELFQDDEGKVDEDDEEKEQAVDPNQEAYDMILNIVERSVYFLSTYDVNAQVAQNSSRSSF